MRLYIRCNNCKKKTYLFGLMAKNRISLAQQIHKKKIGFQCSGCDTFEVHSVNDVYAEESESIIGLAILIIGIFSTIFIGAIGYFIGCLVAAVINTILRSKEATHIRKFNTSIVT